VTLDREWSPGDTIAFKLPMAFRFTPYTGADQVAGRQRYALEYGPLLMVFVGLADSEWVARDASGVMDLAGKLRQVPGRPLHYTLGDVEIMPYFHVTGESYSCFPLINARA
jgi:hypothetical protein